MSKVSNEPAAASTAAEQPARRGALPWFSTKDWILLLAALAVAIGGTAAAALTPVRSADAGAQETASAVTTAAPARPLAATGATPAVTTSEPATLTSVAATSSTSAAATTAAAATSSGSGSTTETAKKKSAAKKTKKTQVPTASFSISVGNELSFGTYAGAPLRWKVVDIDSSSIVLVSKYVLCAGAFESDWEGKNASLYSASEVRGWLRGTFATVAFNTTQTASLLPHVGGPAAGDRVFLLSAAESQRYFPKAADRRAAPRASAGNGAIGLDGAPLTLKGPYAAWWLADAASDVYSDQVVKANGKLGSQFVYYSDLGVRPAIRVARNKLGLTLVGGGN